MQAIDPSPFHQINHLFCSHGLDNIPHGLLTSLCSPDCHRASPQKTEIRFTKLVCCCHKSFLYCKQWISPRPSQWRRQHPRHISFHSSSTLDRIADICQPEAETLSLGQTVPVCTPDQGRPQAVAQVDAGQHGPLSLLDSTVDVRRYPFTKCTSETQSRAP